MLLGRAEIAHVLPIPFAQAFHALAAFAHAVVDDDRRLELAQVLVDVPAVLFGVPGGPFPVEPQHLRIAGLQQLSQLLLHVGHELTLAPGMHLRGVVAFLTAPILGRVMPVHDRMVDAELQPLLAAFRGKRFQQVLLVRRSVDDVPIGCLGVEQAEPVVVLRRDDDVLHPGIFGDADPLGRVVLDRVELLGKLFVLGDRNVGPVHDPFPDARNLLALPRPRRNGVKPPMDEHAEPRFPPPLHPGVALGLRLRIPRLLRSRAAGRQTPRHRQRQHQPGNNRSPIHRRLLVFELLVHRHRTWQRAGTHCTVTACRR